MLLLYFRLMDQLFYNIKKIKRIVFCSLFSFYFIHHSVAQNSQNDYILTNPVFQNYTMKNGLVSNYCGDLLQDNQGYMWFATSSGLSRFNGNNWVTFQQQCVDKKYKLPSNRVLDITEDNIGNIWINTDRGLCKYNRKKDSIISYREIARGWGKLAFSPPDNLFVSSWLGVEHYKIKNDYLQYYHFYKETKENSPSHIYNDSKNIIWACPEIQPSLIKINPISKTGIYYKSLLLNNQLQEITINSITNYDTDTLLLNTKKHGLLKYAIKSNTCFSFNFSELDKGSSFTCSMIYKMNDERLLLIGTANSGVYVINLNSNKVYHYQINHHDPKSILSNDITGIYADNNQGIWFSTSQGVSFFHPSLQKNKFIYFYNNPNIPESVLLNAVAKISNDSLLIGTESDGLYLYQVKSKQTNQIKFTQEYGLKITSIIPLSKQEYLISSNKGLLHYSTTTNRLDYKLINGKQIKTSLLKVKKLSKNLIGVCSFYGARVYDNNTGEIIFNEFNDDSTKTESKIDFKINKDIFLNNNKLWIIRFFNGYEVYDLKAKKYYNITPEELINTPNDYHNISTSKTHAYISTSSGIIEHSLSDIYKYKILNTENGLQGDEIENVCYIPSTKELYYTTQVGIYKSSQNGSTNKRIVSYENYIQKWFNQFETMADNTLVCTVSNYLVISNPELNIYNTKVPSCDIETILINNKTYFGNYETLHLNHFENNITIRLASLVYPESDKNTWYYKLNSNDTSWHINNNGEINLYNLSPKKYKLSIYSVNNEGIKSTNIKELFIVISNPFYKTNWFYILIIIIPCLVVATFYVYRKKQLDKLMRIRNQISRDLHDELGANVSSINIMSKMLSKRNTENDKLTPFIDIISRDSVQISDTINDIIWNINPQFDSIDALIKRMTRYASETLEAAELNYSISVPETDFNVNINNRIKYHLYLMFKEAINNAAKYSRANRINIIIDYTSKKFSFSIVDDGVGFETKAFAKGNGLSNMKTRASEINAEITIHSALNKGTTIHLIIKLI